MADIYSIPMGIGYLGFSNLIFKRKFRWTLSIQPTGTFTDPATGAVTSIGEIPDAYVKLAARPNLAVEETEINHLNAKNWIPGKASWETITVTYYDVGGTGGTANDPNSTPTLEPLFNWLASVYNFAQPFYLTQGARRRDYEANALLQLWDGCGGLLEAWYLEHCWPTAINFGELDYTSSEECNIELTLRYSDVSYESFCPSFVPNGACTPCADKKSGTTFPWDV